jgi:hypothetical protein
VAVWQHVIAGDWIHLLFHPEQRHAAIIASTAGAILICWRHVSSDDFVGNPDQTE